MLAATKVLFLVVACAVTWVARGQEGNTDLEVYLNDGLQGAVAGSTNYYTLTVWNRGNFDINNSIIMADFPAEYLTVIEWECRAQQDSTCGTIYDTTQNLTDTMFIRQGDTNIYRITTLINSTLPVGTEIIVSAEVLFSPFYNDTNPDNNEDVDFTTIIVAPDVDSSAMQLRNLVIWMYEIIPVDYNWFVPSPISQLKSQR